MKKTTIHLHPAFTVDKVDPRIFGGFLEHLGRAVYEGVYEPTSPHADSEGCRTDVLEALRKLKFTAMRYPGGNFVSGYDWMDGVGPKESRPKKLDLAWQSLDDNQFGTDEFMALSRKMDWTPMMAVNLGTGTPAEARNWLEYCNGQPGTYYADMRVANGYKDPHQVGLWCLGNEMDGPWQIGHVPAEHYAIRAQQTARLMKMFDPKVELVVCGSCAVELNTYMHWDRQVLEYLYNDVDYISLHRYVGNPENNSEDFLACGVSIDQQIEEQHAVCKFVKAAKKSKKDVHLSFDEWNVWYRARDGVHVDGKGKIAAPLLEEVYNLEDALVVAQFLNSFIRHADSVKIANLAQIVNVIAPMLTIGDKLLIQSIFYPIEMYAKRREGISLQTRVTGEMLESKRYGSHSAIDTSAILNASELSVFAVNRSLDSDVEVMIDLGQGGITGVLNAEIVTGKDPKAENSLANPDRVVSQAFEQISVSGGHACVVLPPLSVLAVTFTTSL